MTVDNGETEHTEDQKRRGEHLDSHVVFLVK